MNDNILEKVVDELMQLGEPKFFNTIMLLKMVSARANEMNQEIVDLRQQLSSAQFISAAMSATKESLNRSIVDGRTWKNKYNSLAVTYAAKSDTLEILKRKLSDQDVNIAAMRSALEAAKPFLDMASKHRNLIRLGVTWDEDAADKVKSLAEQALSNTTRAEYAARVKGLENIVRSIEWSGECQKYCEETGDYAYFSCCLICGKRRIDGHYKDCPVKAVLGAAGHAN
jgi:hypothetical protein